MPAQTGFAVGRSTGLRCAQAVAPGRLGRHPLCAGDDRKRALEWYQRKAESSLASRGVSGPFEIIVANSIHRRRAQACGRDAAHVIDCQSGTRVKSGELGSGPCRGFVAEATARAPSAPLGVEGSDRFRRPHGPRYTGCAAPVSMRHRMPLAHAGGTTAAAVAKRSAGVSGDSARRMALACSSTPRLCLTFAPK